VVIEISDDEVVWVLEAQHCPTGMQRIHLLRRTVRYQSHSFSSIATESPSSIRNPNSYMHIWHLEWLLRPTTIAKKSRAEVEKPNPSICRDPEALFTGRLCTKPMATVTMFDPTVSTSETNWSSKSWMRIWFNYRGKPQKPGTKPTPRRSNYLAYRQCRTFFVSYSVSHKIVCSQRSELRIQQKVKGIKLTDRVNVSLAIETHVSWWATTKSCHEEVYRNKGWNLKFQLSNCSYII
jgi:hypothetical protein